MSKCLRLLVLWPKMTSLVPHVIREPPVALDEIKQLLIRENASLKRPLERSGCEMACLELFSQTQSITKGFRARGYKAKSFDVRFLPFFISFI